MAYQRVIPRDLFNEASLLKCYGRLVILLGNLSSRHAAMLAEGDGRPFNIVQSPWDGALTIANLPFIVAGERVRLWRPLNSRDPWPLYADTGDDSMSVFTDEGEFTPEFLALIGAE